MGRDLGASPELGGAPLTPKGPGLLGAEPGSARRLWGTVWAGAAGGGGRQWGGARGPGTAAELLSSGSRFIYVLIYNPRSFLLHSRII